MDPNPASTPVATALLPARLIVRSSSGPQLAVDLTPGVPVTIGSGQRNMVVLQDTAVSSTHAVIRPVDDSWCVFDLGSRNGVYVAGARITGSELLESGDAIVIGQTILDFEEIVPASAPKRPKRKKKRAKGAAQKSAVEMRATYIKVSGALAAKIIGPIATLALGLLIVGRCGHVKHAVAQPPPDGNLVSAVGFGEHHGVEPYNASGIVQLADSKFLFVDNNSDDALFELDLAPDGSKAGPLVKRPLNIAGGATIGDMEGLTAAEGAGGKYLIATSSLAHVVRHKVDESPAGSLLRIAVGPDGTLATQAIPNFREWLVANSAEVGTTAALEPDANGLNVEGLAWDPNRQALVLGVRTPVPNDGRPLVLVVRVKDLAGPWTVDNLEMLPAVHLGVPDVGDESGIRDIQYDPTRNGFLVVTGNSTSESKAPFRMYLWDGGDSGAVRAFGALWFATKVKPEGVTHATIGNRGAILFADDSGGYAVVWDDDPRAQAG
jgi:hypothetical protein